MRKPRRASNNRQPTSGGVSLGTRNNRADDHASTPPSRARTLSDKEQLRAVNTNASVAVAVSPPVSDVSTPIRCADKQVPSPTLTTPSLSPSSLSSTSPSPATPPSVPHDSFAGFSANVSSPASPVSSSEKPASTLAQIAPSSPPRTSFPSAAPIVRLPSPRVSKPASLREDTVRELSALLKDISTDTIDHVAAETLTVATNHPGSLAEVLALIIDAAIDEPFSSDLYALLCQRIMEQTDLNHTGQCEVRRNLRDVGKSASSGVFRAQVLAQCRERLEQEWPQEEHEATNDKDISLDRIVPYSGDDAAQHDADAQSRRRALSLIKFISELLRVGIVTERIVHDSIKKLLPDLGIPSDEEMECLCDVLTNVGYLLDTPHVSDHMHNYFARMAGLARSSCVNLRLQIMLQVSVVYVPVFTLELMEITERH